MNNIYCAKRLGDYMKFVLVVLMVIFSFNSIAQDKNAVDGLVDDSKNDLMIVLGGGLAGAVLGLSTLSFVDEPKDHTKNILAGASVGIIAGVIFVAYNQAYKTKNSVYSSTFEDNSGLFDTKARKSWHNTEFQKSKSAPSKLNAFNYSFSY